MAPVFRMFLVIASILTLFGCTSIHVTDREGSVRVRQGFGLVSVEVPSPHDTVVAEIQGVGAILTPLGFSIGYTAQALAFLPERCKVVIWVEKEVQIQKIKQILGDLEQVCPVVKKEDVNE